MSRPATGRPPSGPAVWVDQYALSAYRSAQTAGELRPNGLEGGAHLLEGERVLGPGPEGLHHPRAGQLLRPLGEPGDDVEVHVLVAGRLGELQDVLLRRAHHPSV